MDSAVVLKIGIGLEHLPQRFAHQWNVSKINDLEQPCPQTIVNVMGIVGNVIRNGRHLRFCRGMLRQAKIMHFGILDDGRGQTRLAVVTERVALPHRSADHCASPDLQAFPTSGSGRRTRHSAFPAA